MGSHQGESFEPLCKGVIRFIDGFLDLPMKVVGREGLSQFGDAQKLRGGGGFGHQAEALGR